MKVTVYGIRNCDTMKKTFAWLDRHHVGYDFHDYKRQGVPADRLAAWERNVGWERLVNTRGTTWRRIPEADREHLDASRTLALLARYPSAIRRPVIEAGKKLLVGFDAAAFERELAQ